MRDNYSPSSRYRRVQFPARLMALPLSLTAVALLAAASTVRVPYETPVTVRVKSEVTSAKAQSGDPVPLVVADDVVVNGYVVIARGADGLAEVDSATPAASNSSGQIRVIFKWVRAVDGSKIGVTGERSGTGGNNNGNADAASTLFDGSNAAWSAGAYQASQAMQVVGNVFGHIAEHAKGNEAAIEPTKTISLEVKNPNGVTIVSSQKSTNDDSDVK
jgi:hypothetical protein